MPGTFSPPPRESDSDKYHGTCVTHVQWCMAGSLTSCFLWSRWRGKRSRHSRRMRNTQFYVSGKRPMVKIKQSWDSLIFRMRIRELLYWCILGWVLGRHRACQFQGKHMPSWYLTMRGSLGCSRVIPTEGGPLPNSTCVLTVTPHMLNLTILKISRSRGILRNMI